MSDYETETDDEVRSLVNFAVRKRKGKMPMVDTRNIQRKENNEGKRLLSSPEEIAKQFKSKAHVDQG